MLDAGMVTVRTGSSVESLQKEIEFLRTQNLELTKKLNEVYFRQGVSY